MNIYFLIFTYFIIFAAGGVIGAGVVVALWLRSWMKEQVEKLKNVKVEIVDDESRG